MGCSQSSSAPVQTEVESVSKTTTINIGPPYPVIGPSTIMRKKKHGTSITPVQKHLRWNCDYRTTDRICNFNRHFAEPSSQFTKNRRFLQDCKRAQQSDTKSTLTFYDSNTGKPLFIAPKKRSWDQFLSESRAHGWPSFRDSEVHWENVRCLKNGECVSVDGTHLGHNLPDHNGNRYCINLVSIAGRPADKMDTNEKDSIKTGDEPQQ